MIKIRHDLIINNNLNTYLIKKKVKNGIIYFTENQKYEQKHVTYLALAICFSLKLAAIF